MNTGRLQKGYKQRGSPVIAGIADIADIARDPEQGNPNFSLCGDDDGDDARSRAIPPIFGAPLLLFILRF